MVTSIQNDYTNSNSAAAIQTAQQNEAVQKAEEMATAVESRVGATSKNGIVLQHNSDRVEISQEGVQASQTSQAPNSNTAPQAVHEAESSIETAQQVAQVPQALKSEMSQAAAKNKAAPQAPAQQAAVQATITTEEETTESVSSANTNLTSLSEQEISTLVQQGSVTQAQADKELARRTAQQTDDNDSQTQAANYVEE